MTPETSIPKTERPPLIEAARIAMSRPEQDGFWDKLADFFEQQRTKTEAVIQPRPTKEL